MTMSNQSVRRCLSLCLAQLSVLATITVAVGLASLLPAQDLTLEPKPDPSQSSPRETVRVTTALSATNAKRVEVYLRAAVPEIELSVLAVSEANIATAAADPSGQVLFALDAQILEGLAELGRLAPYKSPQSENLVPFYTDPQQRYLVGFARPWCIAYATKYYSETTAPHELDSLLDPAFTDFIVVSDPAAAPSLYVALIQRQLLFGRSEEHAFGWLTSFDARVREYSISPFQARQTLLRGEGRLGLLPLDLLLDLPTGTRSLAYNLPQQSIPITGLGLALLRPVDGPLPADVGTQKPDTQKSVTQKAAAQRIYDHLLDPDLAVLLANEAFLLPCTRKDLERLVIPSALLDASANLLPYNPNATDIDAWDRRWRERVQGKGASAEQLDMSLDLIFGLLFLAFVYFVFKHLNRSEI